jgi:hypothetical protein
VSNVIGLTFFALIELSSMIAKSVSGFASACFFVEAARLKPTVTIRPQFWLTSCWMFES